MKTGTKRNLLLLIALVLPLLLGGCAAERLRQQGIDLVLQGRYEEGISKLEEAARAAPADMSMRTALITARERVAQRLLTLGDQALNAGNYREADLYYRRTLGIDPTNERALAGLRAIDTRQSAEDLVKLAEAAYKRGDIEGAERYLNNALAISPQSLAAANLQSQIQISRAKEATAYPQLKSKLSKPVSLEFRDANVKMIFDVLARTSGINFVFDKDVRNDLKATIFVRKIAIEDAIDLLLLQSQLEKRILNDNTILIYPNTPQKTKDYQDLVIKSFYIGNADVKQTLNLIKTILKTKDVYVDEKLNLLIMRDTPDAIRIAEKLIAAQDMAEPEVMLEVEVAEVVRSTDTNIGVQLPESIAFTIDTSNWNARGPDTLQGTLNFKDRAGAGNILANPRIRVKNKEKARVLIGDRVPVIQSSTTPVQGGTTTGATNLVVSQSVQYLDVGLKLEVEPQIYLGDEVSIKLSLEVNTLGEQVTTDTGTVAYRVGTRTANTTLRLKDLETATFTGLIRDDELRGTQKIIGLGDIPILGRLFSNVAKTNTRTEIVLSITPFIVRNVRSQAPLVTEFVSGSESSLKAKPLGQRPVPESEPVSLQGAPGAAAPARPATRAATPPGAA
ncbi:MAG TPA: secretin and TonB N-terminal domain-containing protein, partial [Rhodocyclaceae bacterium]|nr:secretin and TonB N-terminal domain-containing protein [Rhodocyclaceae bacterium]